MAEFMHTPGPWREAAYSCHAATTILVDDPTTLTGKRIVAEFETEADARVGAALPEPLETAQAAESILARGRWIEGSTDPEAVALWKLRAALNKAGMEVSHG